MKVLLTLMFLIGIYSQALSKDYFSLSLDVPYSGYIKVCKKIILTKDSKECIYPDTLTIKVSVDFYTNTRIEIPNPEEVIKFSLPTEAKYCQDLLIQHVCKVEEMNDNLWQFFFLYLNNGNWEEAGKDFKKIKRIINTLNKAIKDKEIKVQYAFKIEDEDGYKDGYGVFTIQIPKKFIPLIREYMDIIGSPSVIGIKVQTPIITETLDYEIELY